MPFLPHYVYSDGLFPLHPYDISSDTRKSGRNEYLLDFPTIFLLHSEKKFKISLNFSINN